MRKPIASELTLKLWDNFGAVVYSTSCIVAILTPFIVLARLWLVADRGFDITDEGFYLVHAQDPAQYNASVTHFGYYTGALFRLVWQNVVLFRIVGVLALTVAALWFGTGLDFGLQRDGRHRALSFRARSVCLVISGSLMYYCSVGGILTPSYNWLALVAMLVGFGGLMRIHGACNYKVTGIAGRGAFALGMAVGITVFVKITSAIGLAGLLVVYLIACLCKPDRNATFLRCATLLVAAGCASVFALHFVFFEPLTSLVSGYSRGLHSVGLLRSGHGIGTTGLLLYKAVADFPSDLGRLLSIKAAICLLALSVFAATVAWRRGDKGGQSARLRFSLLDAVGCASLLVLGLSFMRAALTLCATGSPGSVGQREYMTRVVFMYSNYVGALVYSTVFLAACIAIAWRIIHKEPLQEPGALIGGSKSWAVPAVLLFAAPLLYAAGTNNPILRQSTGAAVFLIAVTILLLQSQWTGKGGAVVLGVAAILFSCLSLASTFVTAVAPYRLSARIAEQTIPVPIGSRNSLLKLDKGTAQYFVHMRESAALAGFKQNQLVIDLTGASPGAIFALGGRPAAWASLNAGYVGSQEYVRYLLHYMPDAERRSAWLLVAPTVPSSTPPQILAEFGVSFPADYELVGEGEWPQRNELHQLWRPRARASGR